ncbi:SubName: Full=Probable 3-hydroxybutyryl-CoA dehydrogenase {ECO:0000313/EMBL:CCA76825.1} [Serendipita indica DSM 11827]|nr:SubName: Full=Probable 3-hydroxybutyryl-CoA dehydrogenase {ECO:0000313/EMBL:CCA76825.1} [Serendipita indica DSM 11827]
MSIAHGFRTIGVLGAGQMGLGIAYVASLRAKVPVYLVDKSPVQIQKSLSLMDKLLAKDVSKGKLSEQEAKDARQRITVVPEEQGIEGLKDVDLVVEVSNLNCAGYELTEGGQAATENVNIKIHYSSRWQQQYDQIPFSQRTRALLVLLRWPLRRSQGETAASPKGKASAARVVGLHFFNPVPVMKLVELIPALQTSQETLDRARAFAVACGKEVTVSKDVPGFISNALLMPFINEAIMCLEKE